MACVQCGRANLEGGLCPPCLDKASPLGQQRQKRTYLELRQMLGLGVRAMKIMYLLQHRPEGFPDIEAAQGRLTFHLGNGSIKWAFERGPREIEVMSS